MPDLKLKQIHALYEELILPFYKLKRDMYIPTENSRAENDAEHSWSLAFLAFMLAPKIDKNLDVNKAVTYALIHDLVEVFAGDTSLFAKSVIKNSKNQREKVALAKIRARYQDFPHLTSSLDSYHTRTDKEAEFVYALDKFHNWMTAYMGGDTYYTKVNKVSREVAFARMEESLAKANAFPAVANYLKILIAEFKKHPEFFYQETRA